MGFLDSFASIFAYIAGTSLGLWSVIHLYELMLLTAKVKDIRLVESKISVMKLKLKSKITTQLNKLGSSHSMAADIKKEIQNIYRQMSILEFSHHGDYQQLLNYLKAATTLYDLTVAGEIEIMNQRSKNTELQTKEVLQLDNNFQNPFFWRKLYKYETKMLRLVYNIVTLTLEQKNLVDNYNLILGKKGKRLPMTPLVEIECFEHLWKIVNEEDKLAAAAVMASDINMDLESGADLNGDSENEVKKVA